MSRISANIEHLVWIFAALVISLFVALGPKTSIAPQAGFAIWCVEVIVIVNLAAHPIGARFGVLLAGLCLAAPCFIESSPLARCLLECFMALCFAIAAVLLCTSPITGFRSRLAYLCAWCGKRSLQRCSRKIDTAALMQLIGATVIFAAAVAAIKANSGIGFWQPIRWFCGGIAALAFGEMVTACIPLLATLTGVAVPPFFQSPHRATSVGEFWARRWNLPASELFHSTSFAFLASRGLGLALFTSFAISAVGHALLAYLALGRWTIAALCGAFFLVQPIFIVTERRMMIRAWRPVTARAWTLAVLATTSPLVLEPILQIAERAWGSPDKVFGPTMAVLAFVVLVSTFVALVSAYAVPAIVQPKREFCQQETFS